MSLNCSSQSQAQLVDVSCPKRTCPHFLPFHMSPFLPYLFQWWQLGSKNVSTGLAVSLYLCSWFTVTLTSSICSKCEHLVRIGLESNTNGRDLDTLKISFSVFQKYSKSRTPLSDFPSPLFCKSGNGARLSPPFPCPLSWHKPGGAYSMHSPLLAATALRKPITLNNCHILMHSVTGKNFNLPLLSPWRGGWGHGTERVLSCLPTRGVCAAAVSTADGRRVAAEALPATSCVWLWFLRGPMHIFQSLSLIQRQPATATATRNLKQPFSFPKLLYFVPDPLFCYLLLVLSLLPLRAACGWVLAVVATQLCLTLCDLMDCIAHPALLSVEFPRQAYWNGSPFPSPVAESYWALSNHWS